MIGTTWLAYFEGNVREDRAPALGLYAEVPGDVRTALAVSLGRFQLGEAAGGRIHGEIATHPDPALDPATRRAVQLYIEEEWRHSRELAMLVTGLGGRLQTAHWTNGAFTACRRLLGLRTKMMTLAIAEVIGITYYRGLADGLGSRALSTALRRIAGEESRHLDFQADFFDRALRLQPTRWRGAYRALLGALMLAILTAALVTLLLDHGRVLRRAGISPRALVTGCWRELASRRFLRAGRVAAAPRPGYELQHER